MIRGLLILARPLDSASLGLAVVLGMLIVSGGEVELPTVVAGFATGFFLLAGADTINDAVDAPIDVLVKPWRPIPSGTVPKRIAVAVGLVETAIGLALAAMLGASTFAMAVLGAGLAAVYSWRLSRLLVVKNLTVAFTLTLALAAGGTAISTYWPALMWWLLPVTLLATFSFEAHKDLLDAAADRERGRRTIANSVSPQTARRIVAGSYGMAFVGAGLLVLLEPLGVVYGSSLTVALALLGIGLMLLRSPTAKRYRASFLTINAAFLVAMTGIALDVL